MQGSSVVMVMLVLGAGTVSASTELVYNPRLCFILDGFLGLYGLFITAMFVREKFFRPKAAADDGLYSSLRGQDPGYDGLRFDAERGARGARRHDDSLYTGLTRRGDDSEYRELPRKEQRQRKNEQVYQGLSAATRDTYDSLQQQR